MFQRTCITPSEELPRWLDLCLNVLAGIVIVCYWVFVMPVKFVIGRIR